MTKEESQAIAKMMADQLNDPVWRAERQAVIDELADQLVHHMEGYGIPGLAADEQTQLFELLIKANPKIVNGEGISYKTIES